MYTSIEELPTQVRLSLSEEDQRHWMKAYNASDPKGNDEIRKARRDAWMECRERPSSFSFAAYASVDDWDRDREKVSIGGILKSMDRYIASGGPISFNHRNYTIGSVWGYEPAKKDGMDAIKIFGNLYGGDKGVYDEVRGRFAKGVRGFSVAGESGSARYVCDSKACGRLLDPKEIMEIALCPVPANPHALTLEFNERALGNFHKSHEEGYLPIQEMEIHRDETTCPILGLRKSLREHGIDAHAYANGVFVPFVKSDAELRSAGVVGTRVKGGMLLKPYESALEDAFKDGFSKGIIDDRGVYTVGGTEEFTKACLLGLTEAVNGEYRLRRP